MSTKIRLTLIILGLLLNADTYAATKLVLTPPPVAPETCQVSDIMFSPNGGITNAIVDRINKAEKEILVSAYRLTSQPIIAALNSAADKPNLLVTVVVDGSETALYLNTLSTKIMVYKDSVHAIHHDKIILFDNTTVETGSFNYTGAAEKSNAENAVFMTCPNKVAQYRADWAKHLVHSVLYKKI